MVPTLLSVVHTILWQVTPPLLSSWSLAMVSTALPGHSRHAASGSRLPAAPCSPVDKCRYCVDIFIEVSTRQTLVGVEVGRHGHAEPRPGDQAVVAVIHQQGPAALLQPDSLEYPYLKNNIVVRRTMKKTEGTQLQ